MAIQHKVELRITTPDGSFAVDVWDRYSIVIDMLNPGSPFTFGLWRSNQLDSSDESRVRVYAYETIRKNVKTGDAVTVSIDGAVQMNGRIGKLRYHGNRDQGQLLVIAGKDLAGLAQRAEADPGLSIKNRALEDVLDALFQPLGIDVLIGANADGAREIQSLRRPGQRGQSSTRRSRRSLVDLCHPKPGEKIWQVAQQICKQAGYMIWTAPTSSGLAVVVDLPNYSQANSYKFDRTWDKTSNVVLPSSNIKEASFDLDIDDVPTVVYGHGFSEFGDESQPGRFREGVENTVISGYPEVRTPVLPNPVYLPPNYAKSSAVARREAEKRLSESMVKARTYSCTVQGHGQKVGDSTVIYAVNTMANVRDDFAGVDGIREDMFLHRLEFKGGTKSEGQLTDLVLSTKDAIKITPESD